MDGNVIGSVHCLGTVLGGMLLVLQQAPCVKRNIYCALCVVLLDLLDGDRGLCNDLRALLLMAAMPIAPIVAAAGAVSAFACFFLLARSFAGGRHLSGGDIGLDAGFDNQCPGCSLGRIDLRGGGGHAGERGGCLVIGAAATLLVSVAAAAALHV